MDPLKENLRAVLNFSVSERRGILVLIAIVSLIYLIPLLVDLQNKESEQVIIETSLIHFEKQLSEFESHKKDAKLKSITYFNFDPNLIDYDEFESLGFPKFLIERIIKYRKAGGKFVKKADLMKIYGLTESKYRELEPFVIIEGNIAEPIKKKSFEKVIISIGEADSAGFISLKGIGPVYAQRIVSYRNALGGFVNIEQLKEVYGISDSLFLSLSSKIALDSNINLRQIRINEINLNDLTKHPYFRDYNLSRVIINYREMNGPYKNAEDLSKIHLMKDSVIKKLLPYINFE